MEAKATSSDHRSRNKKRKDKKHRRSKSKSKTKKHRKRQRRSSSSSHQSDHHSEGITNDVKTMCLTREDVVDRSFTHQEAVNLIRKTLDSLLSTDPILSGLHLPSEVTVEEVQSLIDLEHGQAIQIEIRKKDGTCLPVIVQPNATVSQLKRGVERATELKLRRDVHHHRISWKYIWKTYWLCAHGIKLKEDDATLNDYGIKNHDSISFIKRLNDK